MEWVFLARFSGLFLAPCFSRWVGGDNTTESALQRGFSKGLQPNMLSTTSHVFSEIFLHLNWHCKESRPLLGPDLTSRLYPHMEEYCNKTKGIQFFGIGGTANHVHLVIQMEPNICPADWIGKIKGESSHEMNKAAGRVALEWQRGYGAVSFARVDMKAVLKYLANQEQQHQQGTGNKILELYGEYMETVQEEEAAEEYGSSHFEKPR